MEKFLFEQDEEVPLNKTSSSRFLAGLTLPHIFSDTANDTDDTLRNFIGLTTTCFVVTYLTFIVWKKCLFEKYGAYLPIDKNIDAQ